MNKVNPSKRKVARKARAKNPLDPNERRRMRYKTDPAYRAAILEREQRARQRRRLSATDVNYCTSLRGRDPARWALERTIHGASKKRGSVVSCLSRAELAGLLDRSYDVVSAWIDEGVIPAPTLLVISSHGKPFHAYTLAQAKKILWAFAAVVRGQFAHLRQDEKDRLRQKF